ncbi:MAG: UvrD-helicase domain-containing protein [bacterium]
MTELIDAAARAKVTSATRETLFVEAGAGTGKTSALVSRLVALVREGIPIQSIAAITFTEKAASELSERVRKELETEAETGSATDRPLFLAAIHDLDQAAIQTLHSFAMRILSLYPLEAGLPPEIRLRDDVEATLAFRDSWQRFQDELLDKPELERVLLRGLTIGLRLNDLRETADTFNENWERLETVTLPTAEMPDLDPRAVLAPIQEVARQRRAGCDDSMAEKLEALVGFVEFLEGLVADQARATSSIDEEAVAVDLLRLLARVEKLTKPRGRARLLGRKENWDIAAVRALMQAAEDARVSMLQDTRAACICALLPHLKDFVLRGAKERQTQGELEFHDLLVLARNLLRDDDQVRAALHRKFTRVLIDEFQDTDPIQIELASLLAHTGPEAPTDWRLTIAEPGRLFFVGDPKQSIYRFRRADIELFKQASGSFGAQHVPLTTNFRCRPGIVEWVNTVCGEMFDHFGAGPDSRQADWIPLQAFKEASAGPSVHFLGGARGAGDKSVLAPQIRAEEADAIVATVLQARDENWLGRDAGKGKKVVTRFADIAILLPTRTNSPAIEAALGQAGIPFRVESRSLLFAAQEIRDLTNILAAIDDPTDEVSVVAALRTPAFAVEDGELLAHVNAGGRWDYTQSPPDESPEPLRSGFESLAGFHSARWHASIGALVERVIAERKMLELSVASPRPREAWRRLRFVAEQARALGDGGALTSLRQFVRWLRTQAAENTRIAEAVANEPDDDAVRMLTIHAAKGLEFPIVILAGLGVPPRNWGPKVAWGVNGAGEPTLAVHTGRAEASFDTPNFADFRQSEREHGWLERDRLFYVAATRAKERLVVSLFHKAVGGSHADRHGEQKCSVAECLEVLRKPEWHVLQHGLPMGGGDRAISTVEETEEEREQWLAERTERINRLGRARVLAATAIAHGLIAEEEEPEPQQDDQPWKKGRAGTSVGRAVHAVMQTIDLASGAGISETAESQAIAEGIANEAPHIARLAESARTSAAVQAAVAAGPGRYWRELYVGCEINGVLVEGFIDLLYEGREGLVVVDYKTDSVRSEADIDRAMERYRLQGAAYALMLERALHRPVAKAVFVFTEPRTEREVPELDALKAEVEVTIARLITPVAG